MKTPFIAMAAACVLAASTANVLAQAPAAPPARALPPLSIETWTAKVADFQRFKRDVFQLAEQFDRTRTRQADIEAIMEVQFAADPADRTFLAPASPDKRAVHGFGHLEVEQHILPAASLAGVKANGIQVAPDAVAYGFDGSELSVFETGLKDGRAVDDLDNCLSLHELRTHFQAVTGWHYVQSSMFYPGLAAVRDGARLYAFVWPDTMKFNLTEAEQAEFEKLNTDYAAQQTPQGRKRLDELKSKIDGCVFMMEMR